MKTGQKGIALIKTYEGFVGRLYQDSAGYSTIGYGHRITPEESSLFTHAIDQSQAEQLLIQDLQQYEQGVSQSVHVPLTQHQFDALVSFTYNVGISHLQQSTLLKKLNEGKYHEVPQEFKRWHYANGQSMAGLVKRREAEARLFAEA